MSVPLPQGLLLLLLLLALPLEGVNPMFYSFGGVLSSVPNMEFFSQVVQELNERKDLLPENVTLYDATMLVNPNPIRAALQICQHLIRRQVYAIVVSHPENGDYSSAAVSYTSGFYHIPVVGISSRDSAFSDKNVHVSFLRTVPPFSHQADVWMQLLKHFAFRQVVIVYSGGADGRSLLVRFQSLALNMSESSETNIKIERTIEFDPGSSRLPKDLQESSSSQSRVFLLYASEEDAGSVFREAAALNMTTRGYAWIVTEQALRAPDVPEGAIGLRLVYARNESAHIHDSLNVLAHALGEMHANEEVIMAPRDCNNTGFPWTTGSTFFNYIKKQVLLDGLTGKVAFDENGDRLNAEYDVINIQRGHREVKVGQYFYNTVTRHVELNVFDEHIIWPGRTRSKPAGYEISTLLMVLTIEEKPFVYSRRIHPWKGEVCRQGETPCWSDFDTANAEAHCCRGYCIDLLLELAAKVNFTFVLRLVVGGQYGHLVHNNVTVKKQWTGVVGELVAERGDLIVAPLTINPERAQAIEFSKPFKYQGITILEKKQPKTSKLVSFLQPFRDTLWILVMVSVHVVALALYLLDRFSPFGRYRLAHSSRTEEDALNLSSAIWFAWGVLLNSGIGEGTPRSFSARVLGMVWAGFAMIIVASYTANLAAFLVLDRPKTSLTGIHDARLRNPSDNFTYATVRGSAVDMYFRRQVELSHVYRTMESSNFDSAEEAILAVKEGRLNAFIWDSSRLEFEAAQDCELVTAGDLFGRSGYAIGFRKKSPWTEKVTLTILTFHENGFMEDLDHRWILQGNANNCMEDEKTPATLGLENMAGVFILVAVGVVGGVGLIIIEILYKRRQQRRQNRMDAARKALDRWKGSVGTPLQLRP